MQNKTIINTATDQQRQSQSQPSTQQKITNTTQRTTQLNKQHNSPPPHKYNTHRTIDSIIDSYLTTCEHKRTPSQTLIHTTIQTALSTLITRTPKHDIRIQVPPMTTIRIVRNISRHEKAPSTIIRASPQA